MKATVKIALPGFAGNMNDVVIYYNSHLNKLITRRKVTPKFTPSNTEVKSSFAFARKIGLSSGYKADCAKYIKAYNQKNRRKNRSLTSWPAVWLKVMRTQLKVQPGLDLQTISREDVLLLGLPCRCIADSVIAGFLETVPGYADFVCEI